jgi:hypothetical protein
MQQRPEPLRAEARERVLDAEPSAQTLDVHLRIRALDPVPALRRDPTVGLHPSLLPVDSGINVQFTPVSDPKHTREQRTNRMYMRIRASLCIQQVRNWIPLDDAVVA